MNTSSTPPLTAPEKTWLSAFLLVIGILCVVVAAVAVCSGAVFVGLLSVALAVAFFALRRIVDQNQETAQRLRQIEAALSIRGGGEP
jgi:membrane protein implicated in regulation of membrane protease activity